MDLANCPSQQPAEAKQRKCICSSHRLLPGRFQNCYWLWLQAYLGMCHMFGLLCDPPWLPYTPESFSQFNDFYTFLTIVNEVPCDSTVQSQGKAFVGREGALSPPECSPTVKAEYPPWHPLQLPTTNSHPNSSTAALHCHLWPMSLFTEPFLTKLCNYQTQ